MTEPTAREKSVACEMCTLAAAMRDCPACQFDSGERTKATSADVFRMYRRLWHDLTPAELKAVPMYLDYTQQAASVLTARKEI